VESRIDHDIRKSLDRAAQRAGGCRWSPQSQPSVFEAARGTLKEHAKPTSWYVAKGSTYITIDELLAHADGWRAVIQEFMAGASDALKDQ
jgi:hypothetical protein